MKRSNTSTEEDFYKFTMPGQTLKSSIAAAAQAIPDANFKRTKFNSSTSNLDNNEQIQQQQMATDDVKVWKNMRTIYMGDLSPQVTATDILNTVRGGMIESIRILSDYDGAKIFHDHANYFYPQINGKLFEVLGKPVSVRWGKPVNQMNPSLAVAISQGACRCIYVGGISPHLTEEQIFGDLSLHGEIELIKIIAEKSCVFIYFTSIQDAMKCFEYMKSSNAWQNLRIGYGKDRCDREALDRRKSQNRTTTLKNSIKQDHDISGEYLKQLPPPESADHRVLYVGNLVEGTTVEDICNVVRAGGPLFSVTILNEKHCAFLTFIDAKSAQLLFISANSPHGGGLVIKGRRMQRVTFAKPFRLPKAAIEALQAGSSRNLYLSGLTHQSPNDLRKDFSQCGLVEQVHFIREKNTAFVNFGHLMNAVKAMEELKTPGTQLNVKYFQQCKRIDFGKDRVSDEPKNLQLVLSSPPIPLTNKDLERMNNNNNTITSKKNEISAEKSINAMQEFGVTLPDKPLDL